MASQKLTYAIDFGTSNSLLAAADESTVYSDVVLDPTAPDPRILRSLLYFPNQNQIYYGEEAVRKFQDNQSHGRLIRSIKKQLPSRSFIGTWIDERPVNLEDLISFFLSEMRRRADRFFKTEVKRVVLGRPARFSLDDADDRFAEWRLEESAKRAGFEEISFFPEPLAAAYEFRSSLKEEKIVLVADFGGGTSDFTVIRIGQREFKQSDVLSLGGVPMAGDALDSQIMRYELAPLFGSNVEYSVPFSSNRLRMPSHLMEKLCSPADISFLSNRDTAEFLQKVKKWASKESDRQCLDRLGTLIDDQLGFYLYEEIDATKRSLSDSEKGRLRLEYPGLEIGHDVSRPKFEEDVSIPVTAILNTLDKTVREAGLKESQIDLVCATGGTAKVPVLHRALVERFGAERVQAHKHFHSVVEGLARRAQDVMM